MDTNSTPLKIHLSSSSIPIRAPLTIDSDNDQIHSRNSSFSSTISSDFSGHGDELINVHEEEEEEEDNTFVAYPDEEIVIENSRIEEHLFTRPFVKYPERNYDESAIFRASVKIPDEDEGSSVAAVTDIRICSPVVARLTGDSDSDFDIDSVEDGRWPDSGTVPVGTVFGSDEIDHEELQFEGVCFSEANPPMNDSVSAESMEDVVPEVEYLNEDLNLSKSSDSYNDIKTVHETDQDGEFDCFCNKPNKILSENEDQTLQKTHPIRSKLLNLVQDDGPKVESLNEALNVSKSDERIDAKIVLGSYNDIKTIDETDQDDKFDRSSNKPNKFLSENKDQTLQKMHPIRSKLLKHVQDDNTNKFNSCLTILAIGKTGVGKSATINSIFGENKALTNAFQPSTNTVNEIIGNVNGIELRVIDTPGLSSTPSDQSYNTKILSRIKKFIRKHTPDIVLYIDRLDAYTTNVNDSRILRLITRSLGSSLWRNCVIVLTHAGFSNQDEDSGRFVFERCGFIQELMVSHGSFARSLVNPVWLVENNTSLVGCDLLLPLKPASELQKGVMERKKVRFEECGNQKVRFEECGNRVKVFEVKKWCVVFGLYLCVKWRCR